MDEAQTSRRQGAEEDKPTGYPTMQSAEGKGGRDSMRQHGAYWLQSELRGLMQLSPARNNASTLFSSCTNEQSLVVKFSFSLMGCSLTCCGSCVCLVSDCYCVYSATLTLVTSLFHLYWGCTVLITHLTLKFGAFQQILILFRTKEVGCQLKPNNSRFPLTWSGKQSGRVKFNRSLCALRCPLLMTYL